MNLWMITQMAGMVAGVARMDAQMVQWVSRMVAVMARVMVVRII